MKNHSSTRPDLYEMFLCGYHTVSGKKNPHSIVFQQIWLWNRVLTRTQEQKVQNSFVVL